MLVTYTFFRNTFYINAYLSFFQNQQLAFVSEIMKILGDLRGPANWIAWVVAGGIALGFQYWRNKEANSGTFSAAEQEAWNAKVKAAAKDAARAPAADAATAAPGGTVAPAAADGRAQIK